MRPISLSKYINKIISGLLDNRIEGFLPRLVSPNQSGFVKGISIIENVLFTHEIVFDISKRGKPSNFLIKLDMSKAYAESCDFFLMKVLRKIGFSEVFVDVIWRIISNNWYFMLINGQAQEFFHSDRAF